MVVQFEKWGVALDELNSYYESVYEATLCGKASCPDIKLWGKSWGLSTIDYH